MDNSDIYIRLKPQQNRKPTCHPDRKHEARGLCVQCYAKGGWRAPTSCSGCGKPKQYMLRNSLCSWCDKQKRVDDPTKEGQRSRNKVYRDKNPGMATRKHLLKRYGLTTEQFEKLRDLQNNKCRICCKTFKQVPFVDHNHVTGETRGLLCRTCNAGIGFLKEDEFIFSRAVAYLRKYGSLVTTWPETKFVDMRQ